MKKGFTLIELLGVIILLGIIGLMVIQSIAGLIKQSKQKLYDSQISMIKKTARNWGVEHINELSETKAVYLSVDKLINLGMIEQSELKDPRNTNNIINGCIVIEYNTSYNKYQYNYNEQTCSEIKPLYADTTGAPIPKLSDGMIPILWDGTKWVKADIKEKWYDYNLKEWANVVLVTEATRSTYQSADVGTTINESDVLAYLVWIPRYRYKLFNVEALSIPVQTIEIEFEDKNTAKSNGSTNGTWLTHPSFTFGIEISGFWVGKFETTGTSTTPTVKPGMKSLTGQIISNQFATAQKFSNTTTYGLNNVNDAHMMKNIEWGAVVYLTHSIYGKNAEVWINPSDDSITGCAGNNATVPGVLGCPYSYTTSNGHEASTTGNIYGIYDMSGGEYERVMGGMYNIDNTTIMVETSGFDQTIIDSLEMVKYIDKYSYGITYKDQTAYNRRKLGDATGETRGWYGDYPYFIRSSTPWFYRGGQSNFESGAGVFHFGDVYGNSSFLSFRLVVLSEL
ncbi:MAG: prepilin-type N-terminal cleavage/methylation domain-containing protein [Bacilli bacterium]|nr:prepilin-type N-terminal cleavage/methylation domain-containing protein [Bacilli bacterium]MDD4808609.1 prepilin-type N-terminal cleavage/methylation domain-containing protein [Bacilli bacterium]